MFNAARRNVTQFVVSNKILPFDAGLRYRCVRQYLIQVLTVQKDLTYKPYNICFDTNLHAGAVLLFAACALRIYHPILSSVMREEVHVHI